MKKLLSLICLMSMTSAYAEQISCSTENKQLDIKQAVKWYRDSAEKKLYIIKHMELQLYMSKIG